MRQEKLTASEIEIAVLNDLKGRNKDSKVKLQLFYFKIVTENNIRTSSFRYKYANIALKVILNDLGDDTKILELAEYHSMKVNWEFDNPVVKQVVLKDNPASKSDLTNVKAATSKFGGAVQAKF